MHDDAILSIGMINVDHTPARIRRHGHAAKAASAGTFSDAPRTSA